MIRKKIIIHTDGACIGNHGAGGWAAVLQCGEHRREMSGFAESTTNNRMEICAAIHALRSLWFPSDVVLYSDSLYLLDGATSWIPIWERGGWMTKKKKPVKNSDLWRELKAEADRHCIRWIWVRGHSGNVENERADKLATTAANSAKIKPVEKDLFAV